ncbi:hypothetical protein PAAG_07275 [Paracoccidioides lutzii Pb01]|uniref:Uncharacterized protein n=1 Tax=Paracoccidioides lutzii (strain ATCC MYA-826 / Pb01) TaxID=502779 RepID=C1H934_PARBA|nr:hypothetical protein PAAG_07275 [Paracoccidioides lutzii Pb01]EEH36857.2 hypothetical protein PAAG_07275 [Paracoccidioides lutzii Pb01]
MPSWINSKKLGTPSTLNPPYLDWRSNGWTNAPDRQWGVDFLPSCPRHDFRCRTTRARAASRRRNKAKNRSELSALIMYTACGRPVDRFVTSEDRGRGGVDSGASRKKLLDAANSYVSIQFQGFLIISMDWGPYPWILLRSPRNDLEVLEVARAKPTNCLVC